MFFMTNKVWFQPDNANHRENSGTKNGGATQPPPTRTIPTQSGLLAD
ncbi:MAG: hypothetical protein ACJA0Y_000971 [Maricaulis maris]|jgi:hypothetical protein